MKENVVFKILRASNGWVIEAIDGERIVAIDSVQVHEELGKILKKY